MTDIRIPRLLYLKGTLFFCLGIIAATILFVEHPSIKVATLLLIAIWAFARSYYFAFYVVEHYIDGDFKYSGLISFLRYSLRRLWQDEPATSRHDSPGPGSAGSGETGRHSSENSSSLRTVKSAARPQRNSNHGPTKETAATGQDDEEAANETDR